MVMDLCAVRDLKADVFGRPFVAQSIGVAIRSFDDEVNRADENNQMFKHPEDFTLYKIGTYDDAKGQVVSLLPKLLIAGDQVKKGQLHHVSKV